MLVYKRCKVTERDGFEFCGDVEYLWSFQPITSLLWSRLAAVSKAAKVSIPGVVYPLCKECESYLEWRKFVCALCSCLVCEIVWDLAAWLFLFLLGLSIAVTILTSWQLFLVLVDALCSEWKMYVCRLQVLVHLDKIGRRHWFCAV